MLKRGTRTAILLNGILFFGVGSFSAFAAVTGPCVNCHTMHNSQDGALVAQLEDGTAIETPFVHLTISSCIGCHVTASDVDAPKIDGIYNQTSTAGGTFLRGTGADEGPEDDQSVHNVDSVLDDAIGEDDTFTTTIPGLTGGMNNGLGSTDPNDLSCAGSHGCHGDAREEGDDAGIGGFHHGNKEGYRYCQIAEDQTPVKGIGAGDWEQAMSDGWTGGEEHNVYSSDRTAGINKFCANCHPGFHGTDNITDGNGKWIRHPTDNDIPEDDAGFQAVTVDYREHPFAFEDVGTMSPEGIYTVTDAEVACVSCHRAHGSPYRDLLRWPYEDQSAGSGLLTGCLGCHSGQRE